MARQSIRPPAVAGTWYAGTPEALARDVDDHLTAVDARPAGTVGAVIAPHAGLVYSGPVAAWAYRAVASERYDVAVLIGPSHFVPFEGVAVDDRAAFATPLGSVRVATGEAEALVDAAGPVLGFDRRPHEREHSLEMQLPFLQRVQPSLPIVPAVMGYQTRETVDALAAALAQAYAGRRVLLVASTDLSHFFAAPTAARLDARVVEHVGRFDPDGLMQELERYPEHERGRYVACGGGPAVAVMRAALALGMTASRVLRRADSGDVSGDRDSVVGYLAAAFGTFSSPGLQPLGEVRC